MGIPGGGAKGLKTDDDAAIPSPPPPGLWGTLLDAAGPAGIKVFPRVDPRPPGVCRGDERGSEG